MSKLRDLLLEIAEVVAGARDDLNRLDAVAGDGDLGLTMEAAANITRVELSTCDDADPEAVLRRVGLAIARAAPSTAGTLIASALLSASRIPLRGQTTVGAIASGAEVAQRSIEERGGAHVGDKSMLDALAPAAISLRVSANTQRSIYDALVEAAREAEKGAIGTQSMHAKVGRSGWLSERSMGTEDAGAHLIALAFDAAAKHYSHMCPDEALKPKDERLRLVGDDSIT